MPADRKRAGAGLLLLPGLFLLLIFGGCAPGGRPVPGSPSADLSVIPAAVPLSASEIDAAAILLRLEDRREFDASAFELAAHSGSPSTRLRAVLAAGRIGTPEARGAIRPLLADRDSAVAATAAAMLGKLRDTASVPVLAALLNPDRARHQPTVSGEAAFALGRIATTAALDAVSGFLGVADTTDTDLMPTVREGILALGRAGYQTPGVLDPWLGNSDPAIRSTVAFAIASDQSHATQIRLLQLAEDPNPCVRAEAVRGIGAYLSAGLAPIEGMRAILLAAAEDSICGAMIPALRALSAFVDSEVIERLLVALHSDAPHVRLAALHSLARVEPGSGGAAAPYVDAVAADPSEPAQLRAAALAALLQIAQDRGNLRMEAFATDPDWRIRTAAVSAFERGGDGSIGALMELSADLDGRVAASAVRALVRMMVGERIHELRPLLLERLQADDPHVRAAALQGLGRLGDPAIFPLLLDAFDRATEDAENVARLAAVEALTALDRSTSANTSRAFFTRFRPSGDLVLRRRVDAAFGEAARLAWGDPEPVETFVEPALYREWVATWIAPPPPRVRPRVRIWTGEGPIELELFADLAPRTVANFLTLADAGFYDGQEWTVAAPDSIVQGGDPRGDTFGGPGYSIRDEVNRLRVLAGSVFMVAPVRDGAGSQFAIAYRELPRLDGDVTVFGRVVSGLESLESVLTGQRIIEMQRIDG